MYPRIYPHLVPVGAGCCGIVSDKYKLYMLKYKGFFRLYWTKMDFEMVPRGGIEPPTRGFSIPCSTD
jgi:hypothetical protein